MKVGFYQFEPLFGRPVENLANVVAALTGAPEAALIVLPELAFTGYSFRDRDELARLAENPAASPTVSRLTDLCRQCDFHLVTGFAERCGERLFNSALLIGPQGIRTVYRKLHLFNAEKEYFDAGDLPFHANGAPGFSAGMMICFDWAFPEAARTLALQGAEVLCHPSNLVLGHGQRAMETRCLENGVFGITANRIGTERSARGELTFTGRSQVVAPTGEVIRRASADREELVVVAIDPALARDKGITPGNHLLDDRRPEFYGG